MKEFAKDSYEVDENGGELIKRVEKHYWKRRNYLLSFNYVNIHAISPMIYYF